jgi:hypothetical protein
MGLSLGWGLVDLGLTSFKPIYNSRILDASDQDIAWRGKMGCKWELGLNCSGFREESDNPYGTNSYRVELGAQIECCSKGILETIRKLQNLLPYKHKFPHDPEVGVHRLLRYLEDSRKELDQEQWEKIRPLRDQLERYNAVMLRLMTHRSTSLRAHEFPRGKAYESQVENAFCGDGLIKKRPLSLRRVHSFTQTLFKRMLSSDFFYPSNAYPQPVDDLGCIQDTMRRFDPYEKRNAITTWYHRPLKPIRFVARVLAQGVIIGLGCPLGTIVNGVQSLRYLANYALGSSEDRFGNWECVQAYAKAMFDDMRSLFGIFWLLSGVNAAVGALATSRADRDGMIKAIVLKNTFGITRKDGGLLYYSTDDDPPKENEFDPYFFGLYTNRSLVFVTKLKSLYGTLPELKKAFNEFMRQGSVTHFETILATDEGQRGSSQLTNMNDLQQKKRECLQALRELVEIRSIVVEIHAVAEFDLIDAKRCIDYCAFSPELKFQEQDNSWWQDSKCETEWSRSLENAQKAIKDLNITESSKQQKHIVLKQLVMDTNATPQSIFEFTKDDKITHEAIKGKFKTLALIFHPDKLHGLSENLKKEKEELFKILSVAKTMLTVNLPKDEI